MDRCLENIPRSARATFCRCVKGIAETPGIAKIILFGSRAKGTHKNNSDVDLAAFFDSDKTCFIEEYRKLAKLCANSEADIQIQVFGAGELEDPCGIVEEIVKFGVELPLDGNLAR